MAGTKFYLATYSISGSLPWLEGHETSTLEEREREALERYMNHTDAVVTGDSSKWYFGRVEEHMGLIYGKFGKTYSDEPTLYDEDIGDFRETEEEVPDADYSMFILDPNQKLIIYSSTYRVRNRNFRTNFEQGFRNVISSEADISIDPLKNEETLEEVLAEHPVYKIEAKLRPTNPGPDPAFEDLDNSMQKMLVENFGITAERFEGSGINVEEDFLEQVTSMSMSEYGENWEITYGDDEVLKVISSDKGPAATRVEEELDALGELRNYSEELIDSARSYLN